MFQYRPRAEGRRSVTRRLTLGEHGNPLTLDQARKLARRYAASIEHGKDPAREESAHRKAPLVSEVARSFLLSVQRDRKATTAYEYSRMFGFRLDDRGLVENEDSRGDILPLIGKLRVKDVTRAHVARLKESKQGRYAANRLLALVSSFFSWCEEHGYRDVGTNPARGLKRHREEARRRYLSPPEARRLGDALRSAEQEGANVYAVAAIRFLLFTGFREKEALSLKWESIDLSTGTVHLEDAKTSERERALNAPALALLAELPRIEGSPYVFPGLRKRDHLHEIKRVWDPIRATAGLSDFRLHDLRHSFASAAISSGATLAVVGELLGHRSLRLQSATLTCLMMHGAEPPKALRRRCRRGCRAPTRRYGRCVE